MMTLYHTGERENTALQNAEKLLEMRREHTKERRMRRAATLADHSGKVLSIYPDGLSIA